MLAGVTWCIFVYMPCRSTTRRPHAVRRRNRCVRLSALWFENSALRFAICMRVTVGTRNILPAHLCLSPLLCDLAARINPKRHDCPCLLCTSPAHALPMFREARQRSTRKQLEKDRLDPKKSHKPEPPVSGPGKVPLKSHCYCLLMRPDVATTTRDWRHITLQVLCWTSI